MTLNADPRLPFLAERGRFKGNLIQAVLMNQLYSLAREMTNLTDVQIRILIIWKQLSSSLLIFPKIKFTSAQKEK